MCKATPSIRLTLLRTGIGGSIVSPGKALSSHLGMYQLAGPAICMKAGTSTSRTSVASIKIANAIPIPNTLTVRSSPNTAKLPNTAIRIAAAAVITRADAPMPKATDSPESPVSSQCSRILDSRKTS